MSDAEFKKLEDKIYHELMVEYGLEEPEPPKAKTYPLPSNPVDLQMAMQNAMMQNQISNCQCTNTLASLIYQTALTR